MDASLSAFFLSRWKKYFGDQDLPIGYFYVDRVSEADRAATAYTHRCLIGNLSRVREGYPFVYEETTPGCAGGKRYTGFSQTLRPNFEYFLSCGIPGEMEGERYKKSPELVREYLEAHPAFDAPDSYLVFKRWDKLAERESPLAVIFFATPDILSGLFTLANYDSADPNQVMAPMGSGCASIISYPFLEARSENPRCVLGMFDVSARPCVPADRLTFTVPIVRFERMVRNMDESFLITGSWGSVRSRLEAPCPPASRSSARHVLIPSAYTYCTSGIPGPILHPLPHTSPLEMLMSLLRDPWPGWAGMTAAPTGDGYRATALLLRAAQAAGPAPIGRATSETMRAGTRQGVGPTRVGIAEGCFRAIFVGASPGRRARARWGHGRARRLVSRAVLPYLSRIRLRWGMVEGCAALPCQPAARFDGSILLTRT